MKSEHVINRVAAIVASLFPAALEVFVHDSIGATLFCAFMMVITVMNNKLFGSTAGWVWDSLAVLMSLCGAAIVILLMMGAALELVHGALFMLVFGKLFIGCQWAALKLWTR